MKTYMVQVKSEITTYMTIDAKNKKEAEKEARKDMPFEFSVDSFDSDLDRITEICLTEITDDN